MLEGLQSESLKAFMNEIALELGVTDYANSDKSRISAGIHGAVGGTASKLCNKLGQMVITGTPPEQVRELMNKYDLSVEQETIDKFTN